MIHSQVQFFPTLRVKKVGPWLGGGLAVVCLRQSSPGKVGAEQGTLTAENSGRQVSLYSGRCHIVDQVCRLSPHGKDLVLFFGGGEGDLFVTELGEVEVSSPGPPPYLCTCYQTHFEVWLLWYFYGGPTCQRDANLCCVDDEKAAVPGSSGGSAPTCLGCSQGEDVHAA